MPTAPLSPCLHQPCPNRATLRGRCALHRMTEQQRGYGAEWRGRRTQVRQEERACRMCGATSDLTVDHIVPQSLGGTHARHNLRVLCRSCHATVGRKATSR